MIEQYIFQLLEALGAILALVLINYVHKVTTSVKASMNNETAEQYITLLDNIITDAVIATNQTYVNALKEEGKFDKSAQTFAFSQTKTAVLNTLTEDVKNGLSSVIQDLDQYVANKIESEVEQNKKESE
jgi:undecaprenyl pyrophosphate phosphatase UppP